jgi:hypothetical protein
MPSNSRRISIAFAAALLSAAFCAVSRSDAQTQNPAPPVLTDVQCRALIQAFQSEIQSSGGKSVTPSQAQIVAQCLASESQAAAAAAQASGNSSMTPGQAQALAQYLSLQNQPVAVPGAGQATFQGPAPSAAVASPGALGPKKAGVVRIGVVEPQAQMGQGNSGANVAEPIRSTLVQYLSGPSLEIVPLAAMLSSQIEAEAKVKECDYVLYSDISQKVKGGGAMGLLKKAGPLSSMIPGVGMLGGMSGAMAGAVAGTAVAGAASAASTVRAKAEITFDYKLLVPGNPKAVLANTAKVKASEDGQDVITPMIEQAATAIVAEVTKSKK